MKIEITQQDSNIYVATIHFPTESGINNIRCLAKSAHEATRLAADHIKTIECGAGFDFKLSLYS